MNRKFRRALANGRQVTSSQVLAERAIKMLERGNSRGALVPLQCALQESPENADLHAFLSDTFFRLGQFEAAEQSIARAVELRPDNAEFHASLGRVLRKQGRVVRAVQSFSRATRLDPSHWGAADLLEARGHITESLHTWHLPMLADLARNNAFESAITRSVRSSDVVLDIGTGTGLLAMMAARARARHVYACEMEPNLADLASEIIARNGLTDRITVIAQKSTDMTDLPEPASLLITETFDSLLIGEGAVSSIEHAKSHLLKPCARIIPCGGPIMGQVATLPRLKTMHPMRRLNGFDLSPLTELALEKRFFPVLPGQEVWAPLTDPVPIVQFNFTQFDPATRKGSTTALYLSSGPAQALLLWIELDLDDQTRLSATPGGDIHHWNPIAFLLDDDITALAGADLSIQWSMKPTALHFDIKALGQLHR